MRECLVNLAPSQVLVKEQIVTLVLRTLRSNTGDKNGYVQCVLPLTSSQRTDMCYSYHKSKEIARTHCFQSCLSVRGSLCRALSETPDIFKLVHLDLKLSALPGPAGRQTVGLRLKGFLVSSRIL